MTELRMSPEELRVARVKCLKSSEFFTRFFFKLESNRKFVVGKHHQILWRVSDLVFAGYLTRVKINIAPRFGKTEVMVKKFMAKGLAHNAAAKFIHLSYADDIALDNSESVKDLLEMEEFAEMFPDVKLKQDSKAKNKWYTEKKGGVLARSAGGQVTGFGAGGVDTEEEWIEDMESQDGATKEELMDYIYKGVVGRLDFSLDRLARFKGAVIIDDPIKPEDADQDTVREKVNSRFDSTIRNRTNSRKTPIIIVMQRLHPNDLCGYLEREEEADEWMTISLPVITEDGSPLWEFKMNLEDCARAKKSNEWVFETQYMQDPEPKSGLMFPKKELNWYSWSEELEARLDEPDVHLYMPVDPANLGGDDFAAPIMALVENRILVLPRMIYNTEGTLINEKEVFDEVVRSNIHSIEVEGVLGWIETANRIRAALEETDWDGEFRVVRPRMNKHVRIRNRRSFIKNYFWFWDEYYRDPQYAKFIKYLTSYKKVQEPGRENKHDEAPDVCEMAAGYFERNFPEIWV